MFVVGEVFRERAPGGITKETRSKANTQQCTSGR